MADLDILRALAFAQKAHDGQIRKFSKEPYVNHPIHVYMLVGKYKTSKNQKLLAISSLLHDTVEDTSVTLLDIANNFGYQVAGIVEELTSDKQLSDELGKSSYLLQKILAMSNYALVIKLCDRLSNCSDLSSSSLDFRQKYIKETKYLLHGLKFARVLTKTHKIIIKEIEKVLASNS
jgi:(p)ppGpp synthase/HD superfamily hydrolase